MIYQGDIYWLDPGALSGSEPGFRHLWVVVQSDLYNQSHLATTVVVGLTTNLRRANVPGNVRLEPGEAHLPDASVAVVSQIMTVDKADLMELIGRLSPRRLQQILDGIASVLEPY